MVDKEALSQHWDSKQVCVAQQLLFLDNCFLLKIIFINCSYYRVVDFIVMFLDLHVLTFALSTYSVTSFSFLLSPDSQ